MQKYLEFLTDLDTPNRSCRLRLWPPVFGQYIGGLIQFGRIHALLKRVCAVLCCGVVDEQSEHSQVEVRTHQHGRVLRVE